MSQAQYLYATGRVRSLEGKLLAANDVERMIDAKNAVDAFKVFNDLSYADEVSEVDGPGDYEKILKHDLLQVRQLLNQIVPQKELLDLLFLENDFHNIKLFFKAQILSRDLNEYESQTGNVAIDKLRDCIINEAKTSLPENIQLVIDQAREQFSELEKPSGFIIDSWLDKKFLEMALGLANELQYCFISDLVMSWIKRANIKMVLRAKKMDLSWSEIESYLVEIDGIKVDRWQALYGDDFASLATGCADGLIDTNLKETVKQLAEDNNQLWKLEKAFDDQEIKFLANARYLAYGPEVIVAYYLAKKNAVRNIRLIFTGKLNEVSNSEIKERVRTIY